MTISLLQTDIVWGNPVANQQRAEELIKSLDKSDVYVLPEMFSTGFATEPEGIAEDDLASLYWMQKTAKEMDAAIAGSVATCIVTDGKKTYHNRFYFVKPDETYEYYDKHHLFTFGGEHHRYTRGTERKVVEFRGVKFLLQVCYDMRFPIFARNTKENPYDVALYVASWPTVRLGAWKTLAHARAIENQCYVAAVDRTGNDPYCSYSGGTMLIDAYGNTVAECEENKECGITVELDLDALYAFRKKFPVLEDADATRSSSVKS
ncbi:MAG: nitrilase family protein [Bacteroidaceae bacterium]|nr:nitrilase family protein [Bacteroidaceae bacterium]